MNANFCLKTKFVIFTPWYFNKVQYVKKKAVCEAKHMRVMKKVKINSDFPLIFAESLLTSHLYTHIDVLVTFLTALKKYLTEAP